MTEIMFRDAEGILSKISTNTRKPEEIRELTAEMLGEGRIFERFGAPGDTVTVGYGKDGSDGLRLLRYLCEAKCTALDDPTVEETMLIYRPKSPEAYCSLSQLGTGRLMDAVRLDLGLQTRQGPSEEIEEYEVTMWHSFVVVVRTRLKEA